MNGTVTMSVNPLGIDAPDWLSAIAKVRALPNVQMGEDFSEDEEMLRFIIPSEQKGFYCSCIMKNETLKVI
jgi:hypothetical protein